MSLSDEDEDALIVALDPRGQTEECVGFGLGPGPTWSQLFALVCLTQAPDNLFLAPGTTARLLANIYDRTLTREVTNARVNITVTASFADVVFYPSGNAGCFQNRHRSRPSSRAFLTSPQSARSPQSYTLRMVRQDCICGTRALYRLFCPYFP